VYVTLDGGRTWQPLRAGLPSVAVRDLQIQRRENDLVAATFGRGIYIIDDYSPLRTLAASQSMRADGVLAPPRPTRVYAETPFQRAGFGNGLFTGDNPPYGALLSYVLASPPPSDARIVLVIKDAAGKTIDEIPAPGAAGLDRAVWNLRSAPDTARSATQAGGGGRGGAAAARDTTGGEEGASPQRGGRGGPPAPGPLVAPGTYTVQLAKRTGTTLTPIGAPQRLRVIPLER
jgi:hypothetical protein